MGANGEICDNLFKRDWTAELGIRHMLLTKCLLMHPCPELALKDEGHCFWSTMKSMLPLAYLLTDPSGVQVAKATWDITMVLLVPYTEPTTPGV